MNDIEKCKFLEEELLERMTSEEFLNEILTEMGYIEQYSKLEILEHIDRVFGFGILDSINE